MSRIFHGVLCSSLILWFVAFVWTPTAAGKVRVVCTTSDVAAVMSIVGGDRVEVTTLAPGYADPHHFEAKPSYMAAVRRADVLAYNGLQLEVGWLPQVIRGARNRNVVPGAAGDVAMSSGIDVLEIPRGALSRAEGDVHPEGNPHYTLSPHSWRVMTATAAAALVRLDPSGSGAYAASRTAFLDRLDGAISEWEERLRPFRGREIVCYHKQWEYLLQWLGVEVLGYVETKPGIPPSPRHLEALAQQMRQRGVLILLSSTFTQSSPLEWLADRTGAQLLVLPAAVGASDEAADVLALFDLITRRLAAAFATAAGG